MMAYILDPARKEARVRNFTDRIMNIIGNMYPIADREIKKYITSILEDFSEEQFADFADNERTYTEKIKQKIKLLSEQHGEKQFKNLLDTGAIFMKPSFVLPSSIAPRTCPKCFLKKRRQ